jgi:hypothetical protein
MRLQVEDEWEGWEGETVVELTDGSVWKQEEYHYEYRYSYRPFMTLERDIMYVEGMSRGIRVSRVR